MNTFVYKNKEKIQRGDIFYCDVPYIDDNGTLGKKARPVIITSSDIYNKTYNNLTYVPLTTNMKRAYIYTNIVISGYGLEKESLIRCDKFGNTQKKNLKNYVGNASKEIMEKIDRALINILGLPAA